MRTRDVSYEAYLELVDDIKNGNSSWPVETGNSLLGFYARANGVYNTEEYAKYVEGHGSYIENYASGSAYRYVKKALEALGERYGRQRRRTDRTGRRQRRNRTFDFFVAQLVNIARRAE